MQPEFFGNFAGGRRREVSGHSQSKIKSKSAERSETDVGVGRTKSKNLRFQAFQRYPRFLSRREVLHS